MSTATDDDKETRQNGSFAAKGFDSLCLNQSGIIRTRLAGRIICAELCYSPGRAASPPSSSGLASRKNPLPQGQRFLRPWAVLAQVEGPQEGRAARLLGPTTPHRRGGLRPQKRVRVIPLWLRARSASACACRRETGSGASNNWAARARKKVPGARRSVMAIRRVCSGSCRSCRSRSGQGRRSSP